MHSVNFRCSNRTLIYSLLKKHLRNTLKLIVYIASNIYCVFNLLSHRNLIVDATYRLPVDNELMRYSRGQCYFIMKFTFFFFFDT